MSRNPPSDEPRRLNALLLLAILALPPFFVWLLLRSGYSSDLRIGGFLYALGLPALNLAMFFGFGGGLNELP